MCFFFSLLFVALALAGGAYAKLAIASSTLTAPSHSLLEWSPQSDIPHLVPAFQAKIDWDLDNASHHGFSLSKS